jgi:hypothetical protein
MGTPTTLTSGEVSAVRLAARRVHEAGHLETPESMAAIDALVDLVDRLTTAHAGRMRDAALTEMLAAVDSAFNVRTRARRDSDQQSVA